MRLSKWLTFSGLTLLTLPQLGCATGGTQVVRETVVVTQIITATPPPTETASSTQVATTDATSTLTNVPTATPSTTLTLALTTEPTAAPTKVVVVPSTTPTLPPPSATLTPPIANLPPFDGGMDIAQIGPNDTDPDVTMALVFEVEAHDIKAGNHNGDGIASVDMRVLDANNHTVYQHTENNARYCLFGGGEPDCTIWKFGDHGNKWPNGMQVKRGTFFLRATAHTPGGRIRAVETAIYIYLAPNPSGGTVQVDIVQTVPGDNPSDVQKALVFQAEASYSNVGSNDGAGIDHVDFWIIDLNGNVVHQSTERNVKYCAFGGGEPDCNVWDFAQHGNKWPSGAPIYSSDYFLRAVAYAADGRTGAADDQISVQIGK